MHKNMCKLILEYEQDEKCDNVSEVLNANIDLESVNTEALHQFLEEETEKRR